MTPCFILTELGASQEELTLTARNLSNTQINRAGESLANASVSKLALDDPAYATVNEWRASHSYPLRAISTVLRGNASSVNKYVLVSGRLKRMESIALKLQRQFQRQGYMDLISMQDIGGCRAVLWRVSQVHTVVELLRTTFIENGPFKPKYYDYIRNPKPDGYRGIHIAVRYHSRLPAHADWTGRRIEMQIRSTLQHAWATAVETVDLFADEKLKIGQGSHQWSRFFALASNVFASLENGACVPGTPESRVELMDELRVLCSELRVFDLLSGWTTAMGSIQKEREGATYLIAVDVRKKTVILRTFGPADIVEANNAYASAEQEARGNRDHSVVLVSVEKVDDLKKAFPNYYADTSDFLKELRAELNNYATR